MRYYYDPILGLQYSHSILDDVMVIRESRRERRAKERAHVYKKSSLTARVSNNASKR